MAWAPSHYLNQCWLIISKVQCNSLRAIWKNITPTTNHWNYRENFLSNFFSIIPGANGLTCSFIPESKLFSGKCRGQPQASRNYFEPTFWMIHQTAGVPLMTLFLFWSEFLEICGQVPKRYTLGHVSGLGSSTFRSTWVKYKYFFIFASTSTSSSTQSTWKTSSTSSTFSIKYKSSTSTLVTDNSTIAPPLIDYVINHRISYYLELF